MVQLVTENRHRAATPATAVDGATSDAVGILVSGQAGYSGVGQEVTRSLSTSGGLGVNDGYAYDAHGRLTAANETVIQWQSKYCTARGYGFVALGHPVTELAQHREVEARIVQLQPQAVVSSPDGTGRPRRPAGR
ncbi:hypothetical protein GCM10010440_77400 [Kitasatospora cinereorecta]